MFERRDCNLSALDLEARGINMPETAGVSNSAFRKSHYLAANDLASHNAIGDFRLPL
jgi:hypothetical protein